MKNSPINFVCCICFLSCAAPSSNSASTSVIHETPLQPVEKKESTTPPTTTISREKLNYLLATGPANILSLVETEPVFAKKKFVGFRIKKFLKTSPNVVDLRIGDVVMSVNNKNVERPEDFYDIIETLKSAETLTIHLLREGHEAHLSYQISDI